MADSRLPALWQSVPFWIVVIGAALFKAMTTEPRTWSARFVSVFAAVFSAVVFSEAIVDYFGFPAGSSYANAAIALTAVTGEHVIRIIVQMVQDPDIALDLWRKFRGSRDAK